MRNVHEVRVFLSHQILEESIDVHSPHPALETNGILLDLLHALSYIFRSVSLWSARYAISCTTYILRHVATYASFSIERTYVSESYRDRRRPTKLLWTLSHSATQLTFQQVWCINTKFKSELAPSLDLFGVKLLYQLEQRIALKLSIVTLR